MLGSAPPPAPVPDSLLADLAHLAQIPDPRLERTKQHQLIDILAIAIVAKLCGADAFTEMAQFGRARQGWLESFLALPNGIASHDTFTRIFARIEPQAFAACLSERAQAVAALALEPGSGTESGAAVVAIDGKTARRSHDARSKQAPLHTVSAWASEQQLVLGQVRTEARSNEITAIPELLALLDLHGATVTIDAMGCQKSITTAIRAQGAHYVLALKRNQPWLYQRVCAFRAAATAQPQRYWRGVAHGAAWRMRATPRWRRTTAASRSAATPWSTLPRCYVSAAAGRIWPASAGSRASGACSRGRARGRRLARCAISSPACLRRWCPWPRRCAATGRSRTAATGRSMWSSKRIRDQSRVRKDHGPENLATLRRWLLSLLRQDTTHKHGLKARRLQAAWDQDYLLRLLRLTSPVRAKD